MTARLASPRAPSRFADFVTVSSEGEKFRACRFRTLPPGWVRPGRRSTSKRSFGRRQAISPAVTSWSSRWPNSIGASLRESGRGRANPPAEHHVPSERGEAWYLGGGGRFRSTDRLDERRAATRRRASPSYTSGLHGILAQYTNGTVLIPGRTVIGTWTGFVPSSGLPQPDDAESPKEHRSPEASLGGQTSTSCAPG